MKKYYDILRKSPLFYNFSDDEMDASLQCLGCSVKKLEKNNLVFANENDYRLGIVLSGQINNVQIDMQGNQNIIATFNDTDIFGESVVVAGYNNIFIQLVAQTDCEIMLLDYNRILNSTSKACACGFYMRLLTNLLKVLAKKNVYLNRKLLHITKRTTREKVLSYLSEQAEISKSRRFEIPYNRQQLSDYLSVDRSALSAELSKLKKEGIIDYQKNNFVIKVNNIHDI